MIDHFIYGQGIRYATFVLEDGASFVYVASIRTDDDQNQLSDVATFIASDGAA